MMCSKCKTRNINGTGARDGFFSHETGCVYYENGATMMVKHASLFESEIEIQKEVFYWPEVKAEKIGKRKS